MATPTSGSGNLVDEFEEAFQSCLNVLTKDDTSPNSDKDETKIEVEQTTLRFIDLARQMEAFFLQKRFLLSALKPELVIKEDINDLRLELGRKEELLKRHYEKIGHWQNMLADVQGWAKSPAQGPTQSGMTNGSTVVVNTNNGITPTQQTPSGPQTPNSMGVTNMSSTLQQVQQMQQVQQQQQQMQQVQLQQMQAQLQQQQQQQMHAQLQQQMQVTSQQAMFMQQGTGRGGFGPQAPPGAAVLQGPLAFLEKTTSNIGMTDGRR